MLVIGALLIGGKHIGAPDHHHGVMLGAAAGVLFGVSDVAIKALTGAHGPIGVLTSPWLAVTVFASVVAFYASARGLQDGEAVPVIAATSTAANVSCILGGIIVFGDPMPSNAVGICVQAFAFVLVVAAALVTPPPVQAAAADAHEKGCSPSAPPRSSDLLEVEEFGHLDDSAGPARRSGHRAEIRLPSSATVS